MGLKSSPALTLLDVFLIGTTPAGSTSVQEIIITSDPVDGEPFYKEQSPDQTIPSTKDDQILIKSVVAGTALEGRCDGNGEFHLYLTGARQFGDHWHWISGSGFRLPVDGNDESQSWYWSNHLDVQLTKRVYVLAECNWYHWIRSGGQAALAGVEGGDLINLGSTGVAGNSIVTGAIGMKLKPLDHMEIGVAREAPLTQRRDVLDNRLTVDWIIRLLRPTRHPGKSAGLAATVHMVAFFAWPCQDLADVALLEQPQGFHGAT